MFVDYVRVTISAGNGGDGCIGFRREKYVPRGGPNGGDGGKGGDVVFVGDATLATLLDLKMSPLIRAEHGADGQKSNKTGKNGADAVVRLPLGSMIFEDGIALADLTHVGQRFVAAAGGRGGRGNQHFASSTNRAPRRAESGRKGENKTIEIELKQIADVGFVGLPNAGKSTLLASLTAAKPKVAPYPFTTLNPNLGVIEREDGRLITLADLPGLIEGASRGEGLGYRFLRHVERTAVLFQLIAFQGAGIDIEDTLYEWDLVGRELEAYSDALAAKKRLLVLSKADLCPAEERRALLEELRARGHDVLCVSAQDGEGVDELAQRILALSLPTEPTSGEGAI